jgi:2-polyprenyl-6-methoxyphenol hydroxylase-like FAD-dependent oxidoreductase
MPSGLAALEAMGLWPLPAGVRHRPLKGWVVVLEGRPFFAAAEPLGGDRGCWLVDQESLLAHLRLELAHQAGVQLLEGCPVRALLRPDGVAARVGGVVLADGRELGADLVVGCDGRQSLVRQLAALNLEAGGSVEPVLWFRLAGPEVAPLEQWLGGRFLTVVAEGISFALFQEAAGEALRLGWVAEAGVGRPREAAGWRQLWGEALPPDGAALLEQVPLAAISGPQRLAVQVGWASRWHAPGLVLLGDAAHPMSPVRAQGINMALRDALVAAQLMGPLAAQCPGVVAAEREGVWGRIDALLPQIALRRLPEIRRMQELQAREGALGARLRRWGWLRRSLAAAAPLAGLAARQRWIQQQHRLRQGLPGALPLPE